MNGAEIQTLYQEIRELKAQRSAIILAHNYQRPEVQQIADFLGDSLALAVEATRGDAKVIVFCGVLFMAETAYILNPNKTILLPEISAGCPLADMADVEQVKRMREKYPEAVFICYVNSTASVKAECDCTCTSANAFEILKYYRDRQIVYLPDVNLALYAQKRLGLNIIPWQGHCYVHHKRIKADELREMKRTYADALVAAHPECPPDVLELADRVLGTGGMVKLAKDPDIKEYIIATEEGLVERLRRENPDKVFHKIKKAVCYNMKATTLDLVRDALRLNRFVITVPEDIRIRAKQALEKMFEITG